MDIERHNAITGKQIATRSLEVISKAAADETLTEGALRAIVAEQCAAALTSMDAFANPNQNTYLRDQAK